MSSLSHEAYAVIEGRHPDPFHYLGWHLESERPTVRAFLPNASEVAAIDDEGHATSLPRVHDAGLFEGHLKSPRPRYRLRARYGDKVQTPLIAPATGMLSGLLGRKSAGASALSIDGLAGLPDELMSALETRAIWAKFGF